MIIVYPSIEMYGKWLGGLLCSVGMDNEGSICGIKRSSHRYAEIWSGIKVLGNKRVSMKGLNSFLRVNICNNQIIIEINNCKRC